MIRFLQWLILGHIHRWKTIDTRPLESAWAKGTRYHQQCEHCGIVKKRDLI
jgi:hypothetical protein